jgi:hypothetical protein
LAGVYAKLRIGDYEKGFAGFAPISHWSMWSEAAKNLSADVIAWIEANHEKIVAARSQHKPTERARPVESDLEEVFGLHAQATAEVK